MLIEFTKECRYCKKSFKKSKNVAKKNWANVNFCSRNCHYDSKSVVLSCIMCNKEFRMIKSRKDKAKTCSRECYLKDLSRRMTGRKITWGDKIGKTNAVLMTGKKQSKETIEKRRQQVLKRVKDGTHNFYKHGKCVASKKDEFIKKYNKDNRDRFRFHCQNYRARKLINGGSHTEEEWLQIKSKYNNMCLCCKQKEPFVEITRDHIVPISMGGANSIENLQPLCRSCNSIKWKKTIDYRINYESIL